MSVERINESRNATASRRAASTIDKNRFVQFKPRTEFGKQMLALRQAVERSNSPLLSLDQVREEVVRRRGERE